MRCGGDENVNSGPYCGSSLAWGEVWSLGWRVRGVGSLRGPGGFMKESWRFKSKHIFEVLGRLLFSRRSDWDSKNRNVIRLLSYQ